MKPSLKTDSRVKSGAADMAHLASRYGWLSIVFGLASLGAIQRGMVRGYTWHTVTVFLLWCTASAVLLHLAYEENDPHAFAKRSDGSLPIWARIVLLPFYIPFWIRQIALNVFSSEPATNQLIPGVYIGRRPVRREDVPQGTLVVIDLAAECAVAAAVQKRSVSPVSFPILEAGVRSASDLVACIDDLPEQGVFIHCAQGHGRTGFFACAFLLRRGVVQNLPEALALLADVRPKAKLRQAQIKFLQREESFLSGRRVSE